jgi:hypothetical protein
MLQEPEWLRGEALEGFSTPTYAYARNNPLKYADPTGLWPVFPMGDLCSVNAIRKVFDSSAFHGAPPNVLACVLECETITSCKLPTVNAANRLGRLVGMSPLPLTNGQRCATESYSKPEVRECIEPGAVDECQRCCGM